MESQGKELIRYISSLKGASFCSLKNYENNKGEISNYIINVNVHYGRMKENDIKLLEGSRFDDPLKEKARVIMLASAINNRNRSTKSNYSIGQSNAYINVSNGIKIHLDTGRLYVVGAIISKKVLRPIQEKEVNKRPLTIAKESVARDLNLSCVKMRQFIFDKLSLVKCGQEYFIQSKNLEIRIK